MKQKLCIIAISLTATLLVGCSVPKTETESETSFSETSATELMTETEKRTVSSSTSTSVSSTPIEHYCEADNCYREGTKAITGLSGQLEYYCSTHYNEIQGMISDMEEDVGAGSASSHHCEECSKEGVHEMIGLSGSTEYYCTEHYNQLIDMINKLYDNE